MTLSMRTVRLLVTALALACPSALAGAVAPAHGSTSLASCPSAGALVAYSHLGFWEGFRDVVIRPDGRVWLCWGRLSLERDGLVLTDRQLEALKRELGQIETQHLTRPPERPCVECDQPIAWLIYRGKTLPWSGQQPTKAGLRALRRTEAMLDALVLQRIDVVRSR
jgi:hypothetical protein